MIALTERDRDAIRFIEKWRFATLEQLQKAGIFLTSRKRAYHRLYELCQGEYLKSRILDRGDSFITT